MRSIGRCLALSLFVATWIAGALRAQSKGALELFQGGIISTRITIASLGANAFSGVFPGIGGGFSQFSPGAESVRWNPVGLAYIKRSQLYSEWVPPLRLGARQINLQSQLNSQLRSALAPYMQNGESVFRDVHLQHRLLLDGGQGSYAAVLRTRNFTMGASMNSPTRLKTNLGVSGMKFRAVTQSGAGGTQIRLLAILSGTASLEFDLSSISLAMGRRLGSRFAVGVAFDSYASSLTISGFLQPQAQVSTGSEAYAFNDPAAGYVNRLQASAMGAFTGEGGRWRLGFGYRPHPSVAVDLAVFFPAQIDFVGRLRYEYDQIRAFDLDPDNDRPFFDANQLLEDNFTGTHPRFTLVDALRLQLPATLAVAASVGWGKAVLSFSYVDYRQPASLMFRYQFGGDSTAVSGQGSGRLFFGASRAFFVNFGVSWAQLRFGAFQVTGGSEWRDQPAQTPFSTWGPLLGLSGGGPLPYLSRFRLDYDISIGLTTFIRFGTSFYF